MRSEYMGPGFFMFVLGGLMAIGGITSAGGEMGELGLWLGLVGGVISIVGMALVFRAER
ncbi:MAG: hypothetical protein ACE5IB_06480 [Candidatus Geothermarchaeales archaeon]